MKKNKDLDEYSSNRDKAKQPHKSIFWCMCDLNQVGSDKKCEVCGRRNSKKKRRYKK